MDFNIDCNEQNVDEVCEKLRLLREEFQTKYSPKVFYIAMVACGYPQSLMFWRIADENSKILADRLNNCIVDCDGLGYGISNYAKLQEDIKNIKNIKIIHKQ